MKLNQLLYSLRLKYLLLILINISYITNINAQIKVIDTLKITNTKYPSNNPISVGFTDLDDDIKNLQLLGKISNYYSLISKCLYL